MKFKPLHDRVLIKVLDSEEKTAGGKRSLKREKLLRSDQEPKVKMVKFQN